jgi:outer membrane protein assembly factor BamB
MSSFHSASFRRLLYAALLTGLAASPVLEAFGPSWGQWRGPTGQGIVEDARVALAWSPTSNVAWSAAIPGRGYSSPVVWNDRIFLTTSVEGEVVPGAAPAPHKLGGEPFVHPDAVSGDRKVTLKLLALDARTGAMAWERTAYEGPVFDARHRVGSFANTTPATDGERVYAWFGSEGLYAYDLKGTLVWKRSFGGIPAFGMGTGASPVLYEDLVILQCDEDNGERSFMIAVDRKTGKDVWRTPRQVQAGWSTPIIVRGDGGPELVASGNEFIVSYDPRTGKELWRTTGTGGWTVSSAVAAHGIVVASGAHPIKRAVAIRTGGRGDITGTKQIAWERDRGTGYSPSAIAYGDYVYLLTDAGLLTCIDIRTGEVKYEGARPPKASRFYSSPIAFDGKLLISSEAGDSYIVKAGPQFELLATNSLDEPIFASPAVAHDTLYLRTASRLYAIRNP